MSMIDVYRVQSGKPWYRRTWQAEWPGCAWAQRGYTRRTLLVGVWVRRRWGWRMEAVYHRLRVSIRWVNGYDGGWYRRRYTWTGRAARAQVHATLYDGDMHNFER